MWTETDRGMLFPNQFVILCGFPASGKTIAINEARRYWVEVPGLHIGPDNPSRRSFLDSLEHSTRDYTINGAGITIYSAMSLPSTELGVLFSTGDDDFFSTLTKLYDNEDQFTAPRSSTRSVQIERPTVNLLGGATPDYLGDIFPEVAWGQGFTSRLIFIYGAEIHDPNRDVFKKRLRLTQDALQKDLNSIFKLSGEVLWEPDAMKALNDWFADKLPPVPDHSRLSHYRGRRGPHVLKLSMISAISYHQTLTVTLADFLRARGWLIEAEKTMPDVFRAMRQRSDEQLIKEAYNFLYAQWSSVVREKRQPMPEAVLWEFLQERTTSDKIRGVIEAMERSDLIRRGQKPGTYVPQPRPGQL